MEMTKLAQAMENAGLGAPELARLVGLSKQAVYMAAQYGASANMARKTASHLGVNWRELLDDRGDVPRHERTASWGVTPAVDDGAMDDQG
jgi:DNA-binding XRE family transcriptional regulator